MKRVLGLTGSIASGKTTVARRLGDHGAELVDCDLLAREAVAPGQPALAAIAARFGREVLAPDGSLDRARLGQLVFADPAALADLEALVHPRVAELKDQRVAASTAPVVVVEAVKLYEVGYHLVCDAFWVVTAPLEVRLARLVRARGMHETAARQRLAAQGDFAAQLAAADTVIVNDGDLPALRTQVDAAWARQQEEWGERGWGLGAGG